MKILYIKHLQILCLNESKEFCTKLMFLCSILFLTMSCESFLEIDPPNSEITGAIVFEEEATTNAAISEVYANLRDTGIITGSFSGVGYSMALYADELDYYGTPATVTENLFNNSVLPNSSIASGLWNNAYNDIYQTNNIIEGINNSNSLDQPFKDQIKGEALFLRACIHFYLVNLYGDIPYITTPDYRENTIVSRIPETEVYDAILTDLLAAKELLSEDYMTSEKIRVSKSVASALLARVYLYIGEWENTLSECNSIINNSSLFSWESDLNKVFLKESTSTIWQLKPGRSGDNTREASVFIFSSTPVNGALTSNILNAFEPNDERLSAWVGIATDGTETWYYPFKYKERVNTGTTVEYSVVFRLAEQYLIRAEARAQLGDITGAQQDINMIRSRAGLPDTTASSLNDLLDAILKERQAELFTEFGHRFFDLKRLDKADTVLNSIKPGWDATDILLPIPESELIVNPNLQPQNPGY